MIDTTVRRWCDTCGRYTRSVMDPPYEICAEHRDGPTALLGEFDFDEDGWEDG